MKDQVLSKEVVEKLDLDKIELKKDRKEVKVWTSYDEYFNENFPSKEKLSFFERITDFFEYSICWKIKDWFYNTREYLHNIKKFNKLAKTWRPWDAKYQIDLFKFGLTELANYLEKHGHEEEISRGKKINAIRSLVEELGRDYENEVYERHYKNNFSGDIEKIVKYDDGSVLYEYKEKTEDEKNNHDSCLKDLAKTRKEHFNKIFKLIQGQDSDKLRKQVNARIESMSDEEKKDYSDNGYYKIHTELFDGSGIEDWWD